MENDKWVMNKKTKFWNINLEIDNSQRDDIRPNMIYVNVNKNGLAEKVYIDGSNRCRIEISDTGQDILEEFKTLYGNNKFTSIRIENYISEKIK